MSDHYVVLIFIPRGFLRKVGLVNDRYGVVCSGASIQGLRASHYAYYCLIINNLIYELI